MIAINLLPQELKDSINTKKTGLPSKAQYVLYAAIAVIGALICVHLSLAVMIVFKNSRFNMLNGKWKKLESQRRVLDETNNEYRLVSEDEKVVQHLVEQRNNWAQILNRLSLNLPSGVWLTELNASAKDIILKGSVISFQKEEMNLIRQFIDRLKNDTVLFKDFTGLDLTSVQKKTVGGYEITDFILSIYFRLK